MCSPEEREELLVALMANVGLRAVVGLVPERALWLAALGEPPSRLWRAEQQDKRQAEDELFKERIAAMTDGGGFDLELGPGDRPRTVKTLVNRAAHAASRTLERRTRADGHLLARVTVIKVP